MMPMAVTASMRMATHSAINMATKGMYSSAMPMVPEVTANSASPAPISTPGRVPTRSRMRPIRASKAPVLRTTASTPPMMKTKKMMPWASASACGITVSKVQGASQVRSACSV